MNHGEDAKVPSDPQREGHRFIGWDAPINRVTDNLIVMAEY